MKPKSYSAEQLGSMQPAKLLKAIEKAQELSSSTCRAVIAEGGGNLRYTDMIALRDAGKASDAVLANLEADACLKDLLNERQRRKDYHGSVKRTRK